jgi:hypothetical protein
MCEKEASKGYCMGLGFTVWCIHSKHWEWGVQASASVCAARRANPS